MSCLFMLSLLYKHSQKNVIGVRRGACLLRSLPPVIRIKGLPAVLDGSVDCGNLLGGIIPSNGKQLADGERDGLIGRRLAHLDAGGDEIPEGLLHLRSEGGESIQRGLPARTRRGSAAR